MFKKLVVVYMTLEVAQEVIMRVLLWQMRQMPIDPDALSHNAFGVKTGNFLMKTLYSVSSVLLLIITCCWLTNILRARLSQGN